MLDSPSIIQIAEKLKELDSAIDEQKKRVDSLDMVNRATLKRKGFTDADIDHLHQIFLRGKANPVYSVSEAEDYQRSRKAPPKKRSK